MPSFTPIQLPRKQAEDYRHINQEGGGPGKKKDLSACQSRHSSNRAHLKNHNFNVAHIQQSPSF